MDLGQIIYIIAIVAYFIYNATKKKKGADPMEADEAQPEAPQKGLTFEELLKEIRNAQNPPSPPSPELPPAPKPQPVFSAPIPPNFPEAKAQPKRRVQPVEEVDDEAKFYEGAFESSAKKNPYQDLANKKFAEPEFKRFKSLEIPQPKVNPYAELLKNPKTVREAIIVSEILRPKHF